MPATTPSIEPERLQPREDLTIRFVRQAPDEEVVRYLRRCASRLLYASSPVEVVIEPHRYGFQVKIEGADCPYPVIEVEPDVFVAIRNAFARWDAAASIQLASSHIGRA